MTKEKPRQDGFSWNIREKHDEITSNTCTFYFNLYRELFPEMEDVDDD